MKKGTIGQVFTVLGVKIVLVLFQALIGFSMILGLKDHAIIVRLVSLLFVLVEFSALYSNAWEAAQYDKKSYSKNKPYHLKGLVLSVGIVIFTVILWACYAYAWKVGSDGVSLLRVRYVLLNIPFVIWTMVLDPFLALKAGVGTVLGMVMVFCIPMLANATGYLAGEKDFSLTEKFMPFIYEKRKQDLKK